MDLLKKEMDRKRKAISLAKESVSEVSDELKEKKVYMRTVDVRSFEEKLVRESMPKRTDAAVANTSANTTTKNESHDWLSPEATVSMSILNVQHSSKAATQNSENEATKSETHLGGSEEKEMDTRNEVIVVEAEAGAAAATSDEITRELREFGLPVWLFGERNDEQRRKRLMEAKENLSAVAAGLSEMEDFRLGSGHGIRNPFLTRKKDDETGDAPAHVGKIDMSSSSSTSQGPGPGPGPLIDFDNNDPHKKIHSFFKTLLRQWEEELSQRSESMARTAAGKNETKTLKQCKDYIRPLLKLCKNRRLEETMMNHILKIVNFCIEGEFVKANDAYMDVAIGRSAWPIGVTMVGIHARSGRARIESSNVAHVMNSEMQRKYLTSVKRLMSYCQKKRPDVAPSKKVINA